jgi:hypothetical protein
VANALMSNVGTCDKLIKVLGIGNKSNVAVTV